MKKAWLIACIAFMGSSLLMLIASFDYPYKDRLGPGPGFFPFWLSLITGALSLALFIQTLRVKNPVEGAGALFPEREGAFRILFILVGLIGSLALLEPLGFRINLFFFLLFLPLALGMRNWWFVLIFAVVGSLGIFHVFYYWLKVPLPIGILGI